MNHHVKTGSVQRQQHHQPLSKRGSVAGRLPPKLIITRSRTPPTPFFPPVGIPAALGGTRLPPPDHQRHVTCMASVSSHQYACPPTPTFIPESPNKSPPRHLSRHFKCYSNPTSPNYLQPSLFDFEPRHVPSEPARHRSGGSSPRPLSASRFGRQLTTTSPKSNGSPTGALMSVAFASDQQFKYHRHHQSSPNLPARSLSPSVVPHGLLSRLSPTSPIRMSAASAIQVAKSGQAAAIGRVEHGAPSSSSSYLQLQDIYGGTPAQQPSSSATNHKSGPVANGRQQWKKYFSITRPRDKSKDTEWMPKAALARSRNHNHHNSVQRNSTADSETDNPRNMDASGREGSTEDGPDQTRDRPEPSNQESRSALENGPLVPRSQICNGTSNEVDDSGDGRAKVVSEVRPAKPDLIRYQRDLLGRSLSLDTPDLSTLRCQDFGIRDYLSRTNESLDNEEESSLAGDINVGLGIQPPRFSIDSLDSHMSLLLELNETADTFEPSSNSGMATSSVPILRRHSEESVTSSSSSQKSAYFIGTSTNADARNHGDSNNGYFLDSGGQPSSSRMLKKSNSLPHATTGVRTLPKIHEGTCTVVGTKMPLVQESECGNVDGRMMTVNVMEKAQRVIVNMSRNMGTFDDFPEDDDWDLDDEEAITIHKEDIQKDS